MSLRPPKPPADLWSKSPAAALDYEIAQEKAAALGRLGRGLEVALAALVEFDRAHPEKTAADRQARTRLVREAGHVLWLFVVQREACGLRDTRALMRDYRVPAEVRNQMGFLPPNS